MDGFFDFKMIIFALSKSTQQAIHEFIIVMFSVFAATKATEYISLELSKIHLNKNKKQNKNKNENKNATKNSNQIFHTFLLISMFTGDILASMGHFLILYSASNPQICDYQSKLLQIGPILSIWSKASLLFTKYYQTQTTHILTNILPVVIAIISYIAVPTTSYGVADENVPNWCWIKGTTELDNLCRFCAFYGQLMMLAVFTFYTIFTKTQFSSFSFKSLHTIDFYLKLQPELLFPLSFIICFILPTLTRFYQYLYPNDCMPWIITSLTTGCISFPAVVDVLIYRFYIKYKDNADVAQIIAPPIKPTTVNCESIIVLNEAIKSVSQSNPNDKGIIKFIQGYAQREIPYDVCREITKLIFRPKFLSEFEQNQIDTGYDGYNVGHILDLESSMNQLRDNHHGYKQLNDNELAAFLFAVQYGVLDEYGPNTMYYERLLECLTFCSLLRNGFDKVYEQKRHFCDIDVDNLFYQISTRCGKIPLFKTHSLWREPQNVDIIADRSQSTLIENNFYGLLANGNIKCIRIDWKLILDKLKNDDDHNENEEEEEDIFTYKDENENENESDDNIIDYDKENIWMLEPFKFNGRRDRIINHKIGYAQAL